jgi:hypothetical protein
MILKTVIIDMPFSVKTKKKHMMRKVYSGIISWYIGFLVIFVNAFRLQGYRIQSHLTCQLTIMYELYIYA